MTSTAGIVVIGNEVLSGKVEEENARFLIRELREIGVQLLRIAIIRDDVARIAKDVREMAAEHTHVFTSGGVGATHDDVTMEGVARAFDLPIERHPELARLIEDHYRDRKTPAVLRMANLPAGAELIGLGESPFPIVKVRNVYVFPGVPAYLRLKFGLIKEHLRDRAFVLRQVFVRVGESQIAEAMTDVQRAHANVEIGSYPRHDSPDHRVKITVESRDGEAVEAALGALLARFETAWVVRVE